MSKTIKLYIFLYFLLNSMFATAKVIDNLSQENKDQAFTNTDQEMHGSIEIKNLDSVQEAFNTSAATENIKVCVQSDVAICKVRIRERMPAVFKFDENIKSWVLGDSQNFAFKAVQKGIFTLKGIYPGADTNLTVIGESELIYSFYIRIDSVESEYLSDFIVQVKANPLLLQEAESKKILAKDDKEIEREKTMQEIKKSIDYLATKSDVSTQDLDFNFEIYNGDKALMPYRIFDDGVWTYFQYGDKDLTNTSKLPAVYAVRDGYDMPINSRIEGGYLIAETISKKWTIRSGEVYACIRKFK